MRDDYDISEGLRVLRERGLAVDGSDSSVYSQSQQDKYSSGESN